MESIFNETQPISQAFTNIHTDTHAHKNIYIGVYIKLHYIFARQRFQLIVSRTKSYYYGFISPQHIMNIKFKKIFIFICEGDQCIHISIDIQLNIMYIDFDTVAIKAFHNSPIRCSNSCCDSLSSLD